MVEKEWTRNQPLEPLALRRSRGLGLAEQSEGLLELHDFLLGRRRHQALEVRLRQLLIFRAGVGGLLNAFGLPLRTGHLGGCFFLANCGKNPKDKLGST